eukprot:m.159090 g.159090  ORF g.159090 m.159090 type:complete len:90 (+) comp23727_c0_seq1:58-327(+)
MANNTESLTTHPKPTPIANNAPAGINAIVGMLAQWRPALSTMQRYHASHECPAPAQRAPKESAKDWTGLRWATLGACLHVALVILLSYT